MKKILFIFILLMPGFCLASVVLSSSTRTTRAKTKVDSVPLSSAVRHGAGGGYAADPWADYWTLDGSDYLTCANNSLLMPPTDGDIEIVIGFMRDSGSTWNILIGKGNNAFGEKSYEMNIVGTDDRRGSCGFYKPGNSLLWSVTDTDVAYHSEKTTLGWVYHDDGTYIDMYMWGKQVGRTTTSDTYLDHPYVMYRGTGPHYFGAGPGALNPTQGRLYFIAVYQTGTLSEAIIESIMAGTTHPANLSPSFYVDFSQDVAASYLSEIGDVTLTVTGNPVKGP